MIRQHLRECIQGVGRSSLDAVLALGRISAFVWAMAAHSAEMRRPTSQCAARSPARATGSCDAIR